MVTRITPLPEPPQRSDPENFAVRGDAFMSALPTFAEETNLAAEEMDQAVDTAQAAATAALSSASFVGRWSDQSGSAAPPYSVFHGGLFWSLLDPLVDVTASEPTPDNTDWAVSGAPSWYNNFAVGDYLDTARDMGPGWLRRDGRVYNRSTWPELAPLMPATTDFWDWTSVDLPAYPTELPRGEACIASKNGKLVAIQTNNAFSVMRVLASEDGGATWAQSAYVTETNIFGGSIQGFIDFGNGKYLVTCNKAAVAVSTDLVSWATKAAPFTPYHVHWFDAAGLHIIGGASGGLATSANAGDSWTSRTSGQTGVCGAITSTGAFAVAAFFAAGSINLAVSADGVTWVQRATFAAVAGSARATSKGGRAIITAERPDGSVVCAYSDNGEDWTVGDMDVSATPAGLASGDIVFAAIPSSKIAESLDGTLWEEQTTPIDNIITGVAPHPSDGTRFLVAIRTSNAAVQRVLIGTRTEADEFRVPNDNPRSGWIKATSDSAGTVGYAGVPEAPQDGDDYVRNNAAWKKAAAGIPALIGNGGKVLMAKSDETGVEWSGVLGDIQTALDTINGVNP